MAIAYDQYVKLRLSAEVDGQSEVESLSKSADELTKDLEDVGDASRLGKLCISNRHAARFEKMTALSLS